MKKAYLILGPERSGTRLMTRILIEAGCYGDDGHHQRLDHEIPTDTSPIVWRRSFPHRGHWTDFIKWLQSLQGGGYETIYGLIVARDWFATAQSQVKIKLVPSLQVAYLNQRKAYGAIFAGLAAAQIPFLLVSYEHLVQRPEQVVNRVLEAVRLPPLEALPTEIYDANGKWYTE